MTVSICVSRTQFKKQTASKFQARVSQVLFPVAMLDQLNILQSSASTLAEHPTKLQGSSKIIRFAELAGSYPPKQNSLATPVQRPIS